MKRILAIAVLSLAACSSGTSSAPSAKGEATLPAAIPSSRIAGSAPAPAGPTNLVALVRSIGCRKPVIGIFAGVGPQPTGGVTCTLPSGVTFTISTYTPSGLRTLRSRQDLVKRCTLAKAVGDVPPLYHLYGPDYIADVVSSSSSTLNPTTYHANSLALANALHIKLTTWCKP